MLSLIENSKGTNCIGISKYSIQLCDKTAEKYESHLFENYIDIFLLLQAQSPFAFSIVLSQTLLNFFRSFEDFGNYNQGIAESDFFHCQSNLIIIHHKIVFFAYFIFY